MAPTMNRQDSRARAEEAFRLRAVGRTWAEVANALGYRGRQSAQDAVRRLMDRTPAETPGQARAKADETLRITQSVLFGRLAAAAKRGDDDAITGMAKEIRATVAERSKLAGAYPAQRTEVEVTVSADPAAVIADAERQLLALIAERQQPLPVAPILDAEVVEP
ncbi:hypothetical protein A5645_05540 [Mycobacterium asiaticum]|uniref:hypothetical protein n=1 Tax=Mycobacterium asiaticum TaxID=1790 RepID=UPI0007EF867C|nr:hypothetical protein [Mycobacterium asiaticum]OBK97739.1 hypothetical protein A5645_05540 [Mycobacterium asiaticum]